MFDLLDDSSETVITAGDLHDLPSFPSFTHILVDFTVANFVGELVQGIHLPCHSSLCELNEITQFNLTFIRTHKTQYWNSHVRGYILPFTILHSIFSSPTQKQSFGALSLKKHLLTRLWEMTLEQGDLFLLALVVLFCRAFVMADQSDFGRFLEGQNSVDWDLVVIMMGNMLDRMDLFNKKMEFLKFVQTVENDNSSESC